MKQFMFKASYLDTREIYIMAESLEEAQEKVDCGDWKSEDEVTTNFEMYELLSDVHECEED